MGVAAAVLRGRSVVSCCWHEEWLLAFNSRPSISFDRPCVTALGASGLLLLLLLRCGPIPHADCSMLGRWQPQLAQGQLLVWCMSPICSTHDCSLARCVSRPQCVYVFRSTPVLGVLRRATAEGWSALQLTSCLCYLTGYSPADQLDLALLLGCCWLNQLCLC